MELMGPFLVVLVSAVGTGLFLYGKNQQRFAPIIAGCILMVLPWLVSSPMALGIVSAIVTVAPFFIPF